MAQGVFTPYSGVAGWMAVLPSWVSPLDQERIAAYQVYEEIYWNHTETFKLVLRGDETKPIYIPNGRTIVEAAHRYVGKGMQVKVDPALGTPNDQAALQLAIDDLVKRERFLSKYNSAKRYGIMRGDWMFHIFADEKKEPGKRISIVPIDPASYFIVPDPTNEDRIWKIHIAEQIKDDKGNALVRRQTYTKLDDGRIQSECSDFKPDEWFVEGKGAQQVVIPPFVLPDAIRAFPVYHIPNSDQPGTPFGSSEMRGIERLFAAINQSMTDEDIALALEGLGVYATDGGAPVDENGDDTDWVIGPGRVVENAPGFKRVNGVSSVTPYGDHMDRLKAAAFEATGTSDVAVGSVDVQVAESGVALALRMSPTLSKAEEKDQIIKDVLTQMWFDIATMWLPAYESMHFGEAVPMITFGDKLPKNRDAEVKLVLELVSAPVPILSAATARAHLAKFGFEFDKDEETLVLQEIAKHASAALGNAPAGGSQGGGQTGQTFDQRAQAELNA